MKRRNLILAGGIGHPFEDAAPALADILRTVGVDSEVDFDIESGLRRLEGGGFDLLTVYALRWRMLHGEKYAPHRAQWAFSLSPDARERLQGFVTAGGGLLALHTAIICFDDWAEWGDILGARWQWGRSFHPPRGGVDVRNTGRSDPIVACLPDFALANDEVYGNLDFVEAVDPLMVASATAEQGERNEFPVLWTRRHGSGRVVCDLLGHDRASLEHPVHRRLLARSTHWLLGSGRAEIEAA